MNVKNLNTALLTCIAIIILMGLFIQVKFYRYAYIDTKLIRTDKLTDSVQIYDYTTGDWHVMRDR